MRKRTAILLFAFLLLGIGGYVAWCFRPFYLKPRLEFAGSVSPEARSAAKSWAKTSSYPPAREFEWEDGMEYLRYPWDDWRVPPVIIEEELGCGLWATHGYRTWVFSKTRGQWGLPAVVQEGGFGGGGVTDDIRHQGAVASRMEEWGNGRCDARTPHLGPLQYCRAGE